EECGDRGEGDGTGREQSAEKRQILVRPECESLGNPSAQALLTGSIYRLYLQALSTGSIYRLYLQALSTGSIYRLSCLQTKVVKPTNVLLIRTDVPIGLGSGETRLLGNRCHSHLLKVTDD
ncbi:hypothetical protein DPEC_G00169310, partial [Dallia pectoralis]